MATILESSGKFFVGLIDNKATPVNTTEFNNSFAEGDDICEYLESCSQRHDLARSVWNGFRFLYGLVVTSRSITSGIKVSF